MKTLREYLAEAEASKEEIAKAIELAKKELPENPSDEDKEKAAIKVAKMDGVNAQVYDIQKGL